MKKEKFLWILVIVLIALNAATLFFIVRGPRPDHENRFDRTVVDELELNDKQIKQFNAMKREHHQEIMRLDAEMRSVYERYFYLLTNTMNSSEKDSLETILSNKQKEKIQITYHHFEELKSICTEKQKEKFKKLVPLLMQVISTQKNPGRPRRN